MKRIAILVLASAPALADPLPSLPLFASVCTTQQATGFASEDGKWVVTDFTTSTFTVRKIDVSPDRLSRIDERSPCENMGSASDSEYSYSFGCYVISKGRQKDFSFTDGERCLERFKDGQIQAIYCDTLSFLPDGKFIRVPDAKDYEPAENNTRDLAVSVGRCVREL